MTDKQIKILYVALELFATDGFNATSTSQIAKKAGVSEGLIFRHFENKKGLLNALISDAEQRVAQLYGPVLFETDPKSVIRKIIELPYSIGENEFNYWKLQFQLKWQNEYYKPEKNKPLVDKLTWAFKQLKFSKPRQEAKLLNLILEAIATGILRDGKKSQQHLKGLLLTKYSV